VDGPQEQPTKLKPIRVSTPEAARNAADTLDIQEVDFIKVLSTLSRDAYLSLAQRARLLRVPFAGHVPESVSVLEAIEERQRSMEHMLGLLLACSPDETELRDQRAEAIRKQDGPALRKIREKTLETFSEARAVEIFRRFARFSVWQTPTLTMRRRLAFIGLDELVKDPRLKYIPAGIRKTWDDPRQDRDQSSPEALDYAKRYFEKHVQLVGMMKRNGVDLLAGTDTGDPYVLPGFALHDELALLVRAGLTPLEALQTATRNPARFFGIEAKNGTIQTGKVADLVLLSANPLADIHNTSRIEAVVLRGRLLPRGKLDELLKP
jgi:Imidazolonepropionase and related amidohydrolases